MVVVLVAVCTTSCPINVPSTTPAPGKLALFTEIVTSEGAVPLDADALSQLLPVDVLVVKFQFRVPVPALRI